MSDAADRIRELEAALSDQGRAIDIILQIIQGAISEYGNGSEFEIKEILNKAAIGESDE